MGISLVSHLEPPNQKKNSIFPQGIIALIMPGGAWAEAQLQGGLLFVWGLLWNIILSVHPSDPTASPLPGFVQPGGSYGLLGTQNTIPASRSVSGKQKLEKQNKGSRPKIRLHTLLEEGGRSSWRTLHKYCKRNLQLEVVPQPQEPRRSGRSRDTHRAPCGSTWLSLEATTGLRNAAASSPPCAAHRGRIRAELERGIKITDYITKFLILSTSLALYPQEI